MTATVRRTRDAPSGRRLRPRHDPDRLAAGDRGDPARPLDRDGRRDRRRHRGQPPRAEARRRDGGVVPRRRGRRDVRSLPRALRRPRASRGRCCSRSRRVVAAVRRIGGRSVVVTAKYEPNAQLCLDHVGLEVDAVVGWRHGPGKAETLVEHGAAIYVGDTPPDMAAARSATAVAVAVTTGPHAADEIADAGADVVLASLGASSPRGFGRWLDGSRPRRVAPRPGSPALPYPVARRRRRRRPAAIRGSSPGAPGRPRRRRARPRSSS